MSTPAWTPGPWRVEKNRFDHWGMREVVGSSLGINGFTVAVDVDSAKAQRIEADCRLIATAPELAEALEELLVACTTSHHRYDMARIKAREVLAKARGEAP